jgi:hypothetical protein
VASCLDNKKKMCHLFSLLVVRMLRKLVLRCMGHNFDGGHVQRGLLASFNIFFPGKRKGFNTSVYLRP